VTYSKFWIGTLIGSAGFFEDSGDHIVQVVVGIGVVEAFREPVNEDPRVRRFDVYFRI